MDPFEEFEFKPITEGLGFHKKKSAETTKTSALTSQGSPSLGGIPMLEAQVHELRPTLPRGPQPKSEEPTSPTPVDEILRNLRTRKTFEGPEIQRKAKKNEPVYRVSSTKWGAVLLDGMLIVASFLLCLVIMLTITHIDLVKNLTQPDSQFLVYYACAGLFFSVHFIYIVLNRAFLGFTPGEWAFEQRVGTVKEYLEWTYIPKMALRTLLVACTGFLFFPLLSFLVGKDILAQITGLAILEQA